MSSHGVARPPLTTHHSPLTTHHSPLTTRHSPLFSSPPPDVERPAGGGFLPDEFATAVQFHELLQIAAGRQRVTVDQSNRVNGTGGRAFPYRLALGVQLHDLACQL